VPGLALRTNQRGSAWYLYYRTRTGRQRRPKLGNLEIMTRTEARELAREMLVAVARGEDPAAVHRRSRRTVAQMMERFEREHRPHIKDRTWTDYARIIDLHILPTLGRLNLSDVTRDDVSALHLKMRDTPYQANRMVAVLHKAFEMATDWGWIDANPVRVRRYKEHQRRRYPQPDEASRLLAALQDVRADQPYFAALVALLIFTGCRLNEIMHARWDWVTGDGLHLPDSKGGAKIVPLNSYAREVLRELPRQTGNPYIICGRRRGRPMQCPTGLWSDLIRRAGITNLRIHDLRRYYASVALGRNLALETVGQLLGHRQAQTTKRYAFLMTDAASAASQIVGEAIKKSGSREANG
jgi:integrase